MILTPLSYDELIEKGFSVTVAHFVTTKTHPTEGFRIFVEPLSDWDYYVPPGAEEIVGLWSEDGDSYCRWKRRGRVEFVKVFHDDPEHMLIAWTEQGLLADLMMGFIESLDGSDADLRACARYVGFRHLDELLGWIHEPFWTREPCEFNEDFLERFGRLSSGETGIKPCP